VVIELISFGATAVATGFGYFQSRHFVRTKLRFVDAVQSGKAPLLAGVGAGLVVVPLTVLPLIGWATAVLFGLGVGAGVAAGARDIRQRLGSGT
jgi:hypothetical protein